MEDERTNRDGKRKTNTSLGRRSLTIGGEGGITGLLVFGGALAIAGFMAVTSFGNKKHKRKSIHPHHQEQYLLDDDDKASLQHSTNQFGEDVTSCLTSNECAKTDDSSELQPLILEEKIDNEPNSDCLHHQEIAFSDYSQPESATSSNENMVVEESSELFNNSGDCEQEEEKGESENSLITSTETNDEDDDTDSDDATEETGEEDSLEATETTSLDDNEELMEHEYKKYYCESNVCSDLYADDGSYYASNKTAPKEAMWNKTASFPVVQKVQPSILATWVMPMLKLGFLMFLAALTRGLLQSLYVLDDDDSVIAP
ncbi:uncharacterized protein LOC131638140 [Vicia villosa]|uniref:uncharacterized protein LOC131638140 n=1 Tax=Vicia villosa TaxID=3911 RepID=UPI00273CE756|nr:uncharacterized protein LOC131638140 [Vicia villosa]